jgi:hypothetical protein
MIRTNYYDKYKIYGLLYEGKLCYIGCTTRRLNERKWAGFGKTIPFYKECEIVLIEETEDKTRELYWYNYYKDKGAKLLNKRPPPSKEGIERTNDKDIKCVRFFYDKRKLRKSNICYRNINWLTEEGKIVFKEIMNKKKEYPFFNILKLSQKTGFSIDKLKTIIFQDMCSNGLCDYDGIPSECAGWISFNRITDITFYEISFDGYYDESGGWNDDE